MNTQLRLPHTSVELDSYEERALQMLRAYHIYDTCRDHIRSKVEQDILKNGFPSNKRLCFLTEDIYTSVKVTLNIEHDKIVNILTNEVCDINELYEAIQEVNLSSDGGEKSLWQ